MARIPSPVSTSAITPFLPLTEQIFFTDLPVNYLSIPVSDVLLSVPIIYLAVYSLKGNDSLQLDSTIVRSPIDGNVYEVIALCPCLRTIGNDPRWIVLFVVDPFKEERYDAIVISVIVDQCGNIFGESALISEEIGYRVFLFLLLYQVR